MSVFFSRRQQVPILIVGLLLLTAAATAQTVTYSATTMTFGNQALNTTSPAKALTVTNSGSASLYISQAGTSGNFAQTNNCGTSLAAKASCTVWLTFTPMTTGTRTGLFGIADNAAGSPQLVSLSGTGITATSTATGTLTPTPTSLAFGNITVGSKSTKNLQATNTGTAAVTITAASINGTGFSATSSSVLSLPLTLAAGQSLTLSVTFAPTTSTTASGTISLTNNGTTSPMTVPLSGTGVTTTTTTDTQAPSVPSGLQAAAASVSQINLSWAAATDNVSVAGYRIYRSGTQIGTSAGTSYSDAGLAASTTYSYTVAAYDAAGNVSAQSAPASATTSAQAPSTPTTAGGPVLMFSDLTWGPKTGWEGSATKGAAVTIWGKNFGSSRGTNYVTVNGARLINDTDYAEWDAAGPARGLERITFWLNSTAQDGAGTISVTINGQTSNPLPFTVAAGTIYFVAPTGSNSNDGRYASSQGGSTGPFRDIYMFAPNRNPSGDGQYIVYVRGGTYSTQDPSGDSTIVSLRGPYGSSTRQKALIGYPGETPTIDTTAASRGFVWTADYSPYGFDSYFTFSKLYTANGTESIKLFGSNNRIVGCTFANYLASDWSGVVMVENSKYSSILGSLFNHNGYDSYKHNIYIKTQAAISGVDLSTQYTYVGWNEFTNAVASDTHGGVIFVSRASGVSYTTDHVYIHDNYFHDGNVDFIYVGDSVPIGDVYIYNNIFKGGASSNGGLTFYTGTGNVYLYNNTFYQMGATGTAMMWATSSTSVTPAAKLVFKNNIWYSQPNQNFFHLEAWGGATASFDHDLFYNPGGTTVPPSGSGITVTGTVFGNPQFANLSTFDFQLLSTSPAIDVGTSTVNSVLTTDYAGKPRPQGSGYDIGAYEFVP